MNKMYYITGAVILALVGLGIYSTQAQNAADDDADGIIIIEERGVAIIPDDASNNVNPQNNKMRGNQPDQNQQMNNTNNNVNPTNNNMPAADFKPLPDNPGVEVAPDNQPINGQASQMQNPGQDGGFVVEEGVVESTTY